MSRLRPPAGTLGAPAADTRPRRLTVAVCVAAVCAAAAPAVARGATYSVQTCDNAAVAAWSRFDVGFDATTWHTCGYPGGGLTAEAGPLPGTAGWTFTAPPHTEIAGFSLTRSFALPAPGPFALGRYRLATDDARTGYAATRTAADGPLAPGSETEWASGLRGQRALTASIACEGGNPCSGRATLTVLSARLDLRDDLAPQVASVSGGLLAGPVRGTESLAYSASDLGGGIALERLRVDGELVSDRRLDCSFARDVPCPLTVSRSVPLDTTRLADGSHRVQLELWDATLENRAVYGPVTFAVDNVPAPAATAAPRLSGIPRVGETLTAHDGSWSGAQVELSRTWQRLESGAWIDVPGATGVAYRVTAADEGHRLRVQVHAASAHGTADADSEPTAPVAAAAPAAPPVAVAAPTGAPAPAALRAAFQGTGRTSIRLRWGERRTVTGSLLRADGRPVPGARVAVSARSTARGALTQAAGAVTTDASGRFAYRTPVGPSRTIAFSAGALTARVAVHVSPRVTLRVSRTGRLTGHVAGAPEGVTKWAELQIATDGGWRTFARTRLAPTGGTFTRAGAPYGRLRARVPAAAGWPFTAGTSRSVVRRR